MKRLGDLSSEWEKVRQRDLAVLQNELRRFNEAVERLGLPAVVLPDRPRIIS